MIATPLYVVHHDGVLVGLHRDKRAANAEARQLRASLRNAGKRYVNRVVVRRYQSAESVAHLLDAGTERRLDERLRGYGVAR